MRIEHLALWSRDIESLRTFYCLHFGAVAGQRYENPAKGFSSYFLSFSDGARLELMQKSGLAAAAPAPASGLAHFAVSVGSEEAVREVTARLTTADVPVHGQPRWTGDGYYESVVSDPDGNLIEITI
jgi:lactoylglutathione lyase